MFATAHNNSMQRTAASASAMMPVVGRTVLSLNRKLIPGCLIRGDAFRLCSLPS